MRLHCGDFHPSIVHQQRTPICLACRRAVGFAFPAFASSLVSIKSILLFNRAGIRDTEVGWASVPVCMPLCVHVPADRRAIRTLQLRYGGGLARATGSKKPRLPTAARHLARQPASSAAPAAIPAHPTLPALPPLPQPQKFNAWLDKELAEGPQPSLLVYPEGTRSQKDASLPLKRGMLRYAFTRRLPVQVGCCWAPRRCLLHVLCLDWSTNLLRGFCSPLPLAPGRRL